MIFFPHITVLLLSSAAHLP